MKVTLELRSFSSFVFLDRMSSVEVAAGDVRKRIENPSISQKPINEAISNSGETTTTTPGQVLSLSSSDYKDAK